MSFRISVMMEGYRDGIMIGFRFFDTNSKNLYFSNWKIGTQKCKGSFDKYRNRMMDNFCFYYKNELFVYI